MRTKYPSDIRDDMIEDRYISHITYVYAYQAFKLYEKISDGCLREVVDIDKMQYGFMLGRGTVDAALVLKTLKKSEPKIRGCLLYLLIWKKL